MFFISPFLPTKKKYLGESSLIRFFFWVENAEKLDSLSKLEKLPLKAFRKSFKTHTHRVERENHFKQMFYILKS